MDNMNNGYSLFITCKENIINEKKELSKLYYTIYNDIVNYRVLTNEQLQQLESLTVLERLELIKTYNIILSTLYENGLIDTNI